MKKFSKKLGALITLSLSCGLSSLPNTSSFAMDNYSASSRKTEGKYLVFEDWLTERYPNAKNPYEAFADDVISSGQVEKFGTKFNDGEFILKAIHPQLDNGIVKSSEILRDPKGKFIKLRNPNTVYTLNDYLEHARINREASNIEENAAQQNKEVNMNPTENASNSDESENKIVTNAIEDEAVQNAQNEERQMAKDSERYSTNKNKNFLKFGASVASISLLFKLLSQL